MKIIIWSVFGGKGGGLDDKGFLVPTRLLSSCKISGQKNDPVGAMWAFPVLRPFSARTIIAGICMHIANVLI